MNLSRSDKKKISVNCCYLERYGLFNVFIIKAFLCFRWVGGGGAYCTAVKALLYETVNFNGESH